MKGAADQSPKSRMKEAQKGDEWPRQDLACLPANWLRVIVAAFLPIGRLSLMTRKTNLETTKTTTTTVKTPSQRRRKTLMNSVRSKLMMAPPAKKTTTTMEGKMGVREAAFN